MASRASKPSKSSRRPSRPQAAKAQCGRHAARSRRARRFATETTASVHRGHLECFPACQRIFLTLPNDGGFPRGGGGESSGPKRHPKNDTPRISIHSRKIPALPKNLFFLERGGKWIARLSEEHWHRGKGIVHDRVNYFCHVC